jgi:ribulose-phosphate 3-epimerase
VAWRDWVRTVEIEPSLYAADFANLGEQVTYLLNAGARIFHFDIGDGHFVEPITIGPVVLKSIAPIVHSFDGVIDCHLMVDNPERHIPQVAAAGGDSVTFHVEACDDIPGAAGLARDHGLGVGIAFNPETPVKTAVAASGTADLVLCMSIHPGYSGQEFIPESLERLRLLRRTLAEDIFVQVDGGITHENARAAHEAGANLLVVGSAIFDREDLPRAYHRLVQALA